MYLSIPETTVLDPADYAQLASITRQLPGITKGVTYTRFVRKGIIKVYEDGSEFSIGKALSSTRATTMLPPSSPPALWWTRL